MTSNFSYLKNSFNELNSAWQEFLINNYATNLISIDKQLSQLSHNNTIYPSPDLIFRALKQPPEQIKVVILGQDPYHGEFEANGLAFAVPPSIKSPPSLRNIYKELSLEYGLNTKDIAPNILENWVNQGVLLLNSSLTVIKDRANSLANIGWNVITDGIITAISQRNRHIVFILWGNFAQQKSSLIDLNKHLLLTSVHPSPLSAHRGFFGCNHFKLANEYLISNKIKPINWI